MNMLPNDDIGYLGALLFNEHGQLNVLPYDALKDVPQEHMSLFCVQNGIYCVPTVEMVDWLRNEIGGQRTIEVGSGNGVIGRALHIPATDSRMQDHPDVRDYYASIKQATVIYGNNIERYDAQAAVDAYDPHTVVAAWLTHKYAETEHWRGGSVYGVDEDVLVDRIQKYVFIGNESTHQFKPVLGRPHRAFKAEWLLSRSMKRKANVIWVWER